MDHDNDAGLAGEVPIVRVHKPEEPKQPKDAKQDDAEKNKQ